MMKYRAKWSGWLRVVLALSAIALVPSCDPPRGMLPPLSDATLTAKGGGAAASDSGETAAAVKALPGSGSVVLIGGWSKTLTKANISTATTEFFNPATKKFSKVGSLAVSEGAGVAALLASGKIVSAGGFSGSSKFKRSNVSTTVAGMTINNVEIFDPATGTFTAAAANLLTKRFGATATMLASGKVLIAGGADVTGNPLASAEVFDPGTGTTTATMNNMSSARVFHAAILLNDGTVLLAGGGTNATGDLTNTADIYTPGTNRFTPTLGSMIIARLGHAAALLSAGLPGQVLIAGGATGGHTGLSPTMSTETYDPVLRNFTARSSMNDGRVFHSATALASGKVLVVGGFDNFTSTANGGTGTMSSLFGSTLKSAEIYDPVGDTFTCVPGIGAGGAVCKASMKVARATHTATLFPSGPLANQVLIAGGLGAPKPNTTSTELKEAELYNPTNNQFTKVGNLTSPRGLHAAVLLP